jgi:hypothetical protein
VTITGTNGGQSSDTSNVASYGPVGSSAVQAGDLVTVALLSTKGSSPDLATPSCSSAGSPVFSLRGDLLFGSIASPIKRLSLWTMVPTLSETITFSFDFGGNVQTGIMWAMRRYRGGVGSTISVRGAAATNRADSGTSITATLGALADANSVAYGVLGGALASGTIFTPGSGFTKQQDPGGMSTPSARIATEDQTGTDNTVDMSHDAAGNALAIIALELIETAGGIVLPPILHTYYERMRT